MNRLPKLFIILILISISCTKQDKYPTVVTVNIKSLTDDKIQFFYKTQKEDAYTNEQMMFQNIEGSSQFQTIKFFLDRDTIVKELRLDLGEYSLETPVEIEYIHIENGNKKIKIHQNNMSRFFKENIYLETEDHIIFHRKRVLDRYDPFLISTALLEKKLYLEFK